MGERCEPTERILRDWLDDPDLTIFCGHWSNGGVMELLPRGRAELSGPRYNGEFAGLRELRLPDGLHHVHLDLGRLTRACYLMMPSVCYGFRPSFELRLAGQGDDPVHRFGLGLAVGQPYAGAGLREEAVMRYFRRAALHLQAYPQQVSFECNDAHAQASSGDWNAIGELLATHQPWQPLRQALAAGRGRIEVSP